METLVQLKLKLQKKKGTIKEIIQKKIEDNEKELQKWKDLLFITVDESLDEKIDKLASQVHFFFVFYSIPLSESIVSLSVNCFYSKIQALCNQL